MTTDGIKVLVVDDEETVRILLQRVLQAAGYDAVIAADGEEALSVIANGDIDVVLLDINMPGLSGMDVLGKISTDWPNVCVIMVTAVADVQTAVATRRL
ncbi:MAG: response regulator [Deltaproteobacteria bacterium]|nr:response regulator [Deltaproteobacteria bacterium]